MTAPAFDRSRIEQLGALARLSVPADRQEELANRLGKVLEAFDALRAVDTSEAPTIARPDLRLREDEARPTLPHDRVLGGSRHTAADCFVVPRVVEG